MTTKKSLVLLFLLILLGLLVRLYKIDNPIADWHSWRQADTAAVTRNFFKFGIHLLSPRYDDFSDVSGNGLFNPQGYRFVEFPIFNLVHYSLARLFPFQSLEYWGRLTSILASLASAVLLYFIVSKHTSRATGLLSSFFYLFLPYNIYFTRVILPDPLMVTLVLAALLTFDSSVVLAGIFASLAILVKPTAIFFLLPLVWQLRSKFKLKNILVLFALCFMPFAIWRTFSHAHPEGIPASLWLLNGNNIRFKGAFFHWIFGARLAIMILGSWALWPFVMGVIALVKKSPYLLIYVLGSLLYLFTFATGNVQHDYYQIPIIPSISIALAAGCVFIWHLFPSDLITQLSARSLLIFSVVLALALAWYDIRPNYQINHYEIIVAGLAVDRLTPPDAVVLTPYQGDTAFLYQTNRHGFPFLPLPVKDLIDTYHASYYVSVNYDDQTHAVMAKYTIVEQTPQYVIVKLEEPL